MYVQVLDIYINIHTHTHKGCSKNSENITTLKDTRTSPVHNKSGLVKDYISPRTGLISMIPFPFKAANQIQVLVLVI